MKKYILVIFYIILYIAGLILLKFGGNTGNLTFENGSFIFSMNLISLVGFISYILSFLLFTNIVVKFNLSYIMPISSGLVQVITLISGFVIFNEQIKVKGIIGAIIVILGIIIMNLKNKNLKNELINE